MADDSLALRCPGVRLMREAAQARWPKTILECADGGAADDVTLRPDISVAGSVDPLQTVGGAWTNAYVQGVTHAKHRITVTAGSPARRSSPGRGWRRRPRN